jgi:hypothetical protein
MAMSRKMKIIMLGILFIIVCIVGLVVFHFSSEWEKDRFVGEWADPQLIGDNWAFFPDRSFGVQTNDVWYNDGFYDIKEGKLIVTLPNSGGTEEYYYVLSDNDMVLTLYMEPPPADIYRVYDKVVQ